VCFAIFRRFRILAETAFTENVPEVTELEGFS